MREALAIGFLSFARAKREREAFEVLKEHAATVLEVVKKFEESVAAFSKRDPARVRALGKELDGLETEADSGRRKFEARLSNGAFLPVFRGDLSGLAERVDDVADMAQEAARAIRWRDALFEALARAEKKNSKVKAIRGGLAELAGVATKAAQALKDSVDALMVDIDAAVLKSTEIERLEHESDLLEEKLIRQLYSFEEFLDPVSVAQIKDIVDKMGMISNSAEDAGDIISAIGHTLRA